MADLIPVSICKEEPRANAIFVHGLGGDPYSTWRDGQEFQSFWPRWLAEDIPGLAVYLVGYAASISRWRGAAMHLTDRATNVLARLLAEPQLHKGKLILIGHSLGGLVIKQLLRTAESEGRHRAEAADLINRVERVIFLATPHAGSGLANWADRLRILIRPSASTASLVRNDPNLRDLNLWYRDWANAHRISNLILTETETKRIAGMVVPPDSGDPGLAGPRPVPIGSNHRGICKPGDRSSEIYVNIRAFIERPIEARAHERRSQAEPPPPRPFIGVPPRIAGFTGRADELDRIHDILLKDKPAAVTQSVGRATVQGLGGVGKTSLAAEYAYRYRKLYAGVCWCSSETRTGLVTSLAGLAVTLGAASADEADVEEAAKAALRRLNEQRATWLLVYDNVSSPDEIVDLLPSGVARVLITSRFSDWNALADEVSLDVLPVPEAAAFLQSRSAREDASGAQLLADALGCLPLALDHAAAYCKRTQMSFSEYASKATSLITSVPRGVGYPRSVAATFDLAIAEAITQSQAAEALIAYLAQCAPERIPMTLVDGAIEDEAERLQALAALAEVSLVKSDPFEDGTLAVTVHRLVQAVARARSEAKGIAQGAAERIIERLSTTYPKLSFSDPKSWPLCAQLTPHLLVWGEDAPTRTANAQWADLLMRAGLYLHGRGSYVQAAPLYRRALAINEKVLGPEHPETATSLSRLASLVQDQGDHTSARQLQERALAIREKMLGPEHPDVALSLNHLAIVLEAQGDITTARQLFERALAIREKTLDPEHPYTATTLHNLAHLLQNQDDLADVGRARLLHERALAIHAKVLGPEHPETATSLNYLAFLLQAQGDFAGARPLFERALAIREKTLDPEHPEVALSLNNFARVLNSSGHAKEAEPVFQRAIAIGKKALGADHPFTHRYCSNCARLLIDTERPNEALMMAEAALEVHAATNGPNHHWTRDSARVTADALDALGRTEEAKALRERYGITRGGRDTNAELKS